MCLLYVGCSSLKNKDVQLVSIPVMYCPAPEPFVRPPLMIHQMSDTQLSSPGELAKYYKATIQQLQGYTQQLELQLDGYNKINKEFENKKNQLFKDTK